jgi:hypothetical protein
LVDVAPATVIAQDRAGDLHVSQSLMELLDPFGLRGSLPPLAAGMRSSCFGRAGEGNQERCRTACSTKP